MCSYRAHSGTFKYVNSSGHSAETLGSGREQIGVCDVANEEKLPVGKGAIYLEIPLCICYCEQIPNKSDCGMEGFGLVHTAG